MNILWRVLPARILWLGLLSIVLLGAAFYLVLGQGVKSSITQLHLRQEQTIARAEASNIIGFFQSFGNSVAVLAQQSSIERRDANTLRDMDTFVEQRRAQGLVAGVVLTDKNGIVQLSSNVLGTRDHGQSLADRDFFNWAKKQEKKGNFFINEPVVSRLGASIGQTIVVVASPVYQNGVFEGVVASSVKLQPLAEHFFGIMKVSDSTKVYLIGGQGNLIYSNSAPNVIGSNISELFSDDQTLRDNIENALKSKEEGQLQTENYLAAYSPISLGTQNWLLIISSPAQEVADLARPIHIRQTAIFVLVSLTILLFGTIALKRNQF